VRPVRPEVIVPQRTSCEIPGIHVYRRILPACDVTTKRAFRLTTVSRTIADLASVLADDALEVAVDDAITRGLTSLDALLQRVTGPRRGVAGVGVLRAIVTDRTTHGTPASYLETLALRRLRKDGLPRPIAQFVIRDDAGAFVARPDLVYRDAGLAIELDGDRYHATKRQRRDDRTRQNRLVLAGYTPLRFDDAAVRSGEMTRSLRTYFNRA
jgi:very-short-patch-repair endonuclease